jgi:Na+/H+ antiporter NhaC
MKSMMETIYVVMIVIGLAMIVYDVINNANTAASILKRVQGNKSRSHNKEVGI